MSEEKGSQDMYIRLVEMRLLPLFTSGSPILPYLKPIKTLSECQLHPPVILMVALLRLYTSCSRFNR